MSNSSLDVPQPTAPGVVTRGPGETDEPGGMRAPSARVLGSGLRARELGLILAISTTAFLFWGGPLWDAPVGASHVWRIGGSYLIVIPLVLAALAHARLTSVGHFLGSVGILWSAKMLITATLYAYVAPESATQYAPARTWETAQETEPLRQDVQHGPTTAGAGSGDIAGVVVAKGTVELFAAVIVDDLPASPFRLPPADVAVAIERARYGQSVYVAASQDRILLKNLDASLHTLRVTQDRRAIANIPVPAGAREHLIVTPPPGLYHLSCENHDSEHALLMVVDHPFFTVTDANGHFHLPGVPAGERSIVVFHDGHVPTRRAVTLAPSTRLELSIQIR